MWRRGRPAAWPPRTRPAPAACFPARPRTARSPSNRACCRVPCRPRGPHRPESASHNEQRPLGHVFQDPAERPPDGRLDEAAHTSGDGLEDVTQELLQFLFIADFQQLGCQLDLLRLGQRTADLAATNQRAKDAAEELFRFAVLTGLPELAELGFPELAGLPELGLPELTELGGLPELTELAKLGLAQLTELAKFGLPELGLPEFAQFRLVGTHVLSPLHCLSSEAGGTSVPDKDNRLTAPDPSAAARPHPGGTPLQSRQQTRRVGTCRPLDRGPCRHRPGHVPGCESCILHGRTGKSDELPGDLKLPVFAAQPFQLQAEKRAENRGGARADCPAARGHP